MDVQQDEGCPMRDSEGRRLAFEAEKEWLAMGKVNVRCPKCDGHPSVDINSHRAIVKCPCGYVRMAELREI